jgi:hypothetical protein
MSIGSIVNATICNRTPICQRIATRNNDEARS